MARAGGPLTPPRRARRAIPFLKSQLEGGRAQEKFSRPTMEKAAVACAAIENFYDDLYKTLREREQRRQTLEVKMQQKALPADEKERWRKQLQSQVRSARDSMVGLARSPACRP